LDDSEKQLANIQTSIVELETWYSHINYLSKSITEK
ncbi:unnamed protein product, partial [Rotaria sp. Silwood1]